MTLESLEDRRMLAVTVNTHNDVVDPNDGVTSLREAILQANTTPGPDLITFNSTLAGQAILLNGTELAITEALTIDARELAESVTINANQLSRIFNITATTGDFLIAGLTLTGGQTTGDNSSHDDDTFSGGAIRSLTAGNLMLDRSAVVQNDVVGFLTRGGGVFSNGPVALTESTVNHNSSVREGGGVWSHGPVTLDQSTVNGNSSNSGGGISTNGAVAVIQSTVSNNSSPSEGGGIWSRHAVTVTDSTISGNSSAYGGGIWSNGPVTLALSNIHENSAYDYVFLAAQAAGGGIWSSGTVTLTRSSVSGNMTEADGGGIWSNGAVEVTQSIISKNTSSAAGGGIWSNSDVKLDQTTVNGNQAEWIGGGIGSHGAVTLTQSTVSGNSALHPLGIVSTAGGGIWSDGSMVVTQSTISENTSWSGGGIWSSGDIRLSRTTVTNNVTALDESHGGGIFQSDDSVSPLWLNDSILAGNLTNDGSPSDLAVGSSSVVHARYNLIGVADGLDFSNDSVGNLTGTSASPLDPRLGPLGNYGGIVNTHPLLADSPAIDRGEPLIDVVLAQFDGRGAPFVRVFDGDGNGTARIDIGAYERQSLGGTQSFVVDTLELVRDGDYTQGNVSIEEAIGLANGNVDVVDVVLITEVHAESIDVLSIVELLATEPVEFRLVEPQPPAVFSWISPRDGLVTLVGTLWQTELSETDHNWTLLVDSRVITSGTLLTIPLDDGQYARQYTPLKPLSIAFGSSGPEAIRNVPVAAGSVVSVVVTGDAGRAVAADIAATFHPGNAPHYELGALPTRFVVDGQPLEFIVDRPEGWTGPLTVHSTPRPEGLIEFDAATGWFRYTPSAADHFDFDILFQIGDGGTWEAPRSQVVTISPSEIEPEFSFVSKPQEKTLNMADYITYSETADEPVPEGEYFNGRESNGSIKLRNVEISGKTIHLTPNHENGVFERIAYDPGNATLAANLNVKSLTIYAETVVVESHFWLPQADVTIYAKTLEFIDARGTSSRIETTPLDYALRAKSAEETGGMGENGSKGANAGDIRLFVDSMSVPVGTSEPRFILRGGKGQTAGPGKDGEPGTPTDLQTYGSIVEDGVECSIVYHHETFVWTSPFRQTTRTHGTQVMPGNGDHARRPGTPGTGGAGGNLIVNFANAVPWPGLAVLEAGSRGTRADDAKGGRPGTPQCAVWYTTISWVDLGPIRRDARVDDKRIPTPGRDYPAPEGQDGVPGSVEFNVTASNNWLHPAALSAMVSYAKDMYINGHIADAARTFSEYQRLLETVTIPPEYADEFAELQVEIAKLAHQAANGLDYFGNPPGWVPTLSFAVNYLNFQNSIDNDIRIIYLTRLIQDLDDKHLDTQAALTKSLENIDADIEEALKEFNEAHDLLPNLRSQLNDINVQTSIVERMLEAKEQELRAQAEENLRPSFFQRALGFIGAALSFIPGVGTAIGGVVGAALGGIGSFLSSPSFQGLGQAVEGITSAFGKERLDKVASEAKKLGEQLQPPKNLNLATVTDYAKKLGEIVKGWGPALDSAKTAIQGTQVSQSALEQELNRLKSEDARFNELVANVLELNTEKEVFAQTLAQTIQKIVSSTQRIAFNYATAVTFKSQLDENTAVGLRHDTRERIKQMERNAQERLLKNQYYFGKAYEYEFLTPYYGDFQLEYMMDAIARLLDDPNVEPLNVALSTLKLPYEEQLRTIIEKDILPNHTRRPPTELSSLTLSPSQLAELNEEGKVTINLVEMGYIRADAQRATLIDIRVQQAKASASNPSAQSLNVVFDFNHSAKSIIQARGTKYVFQHRTIPTTVNESPFPFYWRTTYDARADRVIERARFVPDPVATILGLNLPSDLMFARPSVWADITITMSKPSEVGDITSFEFLVEYDSFNADLQSVLLDVRIADRLAPRIGVSAKDKNNEQDGIGSFTRIFPRSLSETVTLIAEPRQGSLEFSEWRWRNLVTGAWFTSNSASLTLPLNQSTQVYAVYAPVHVSFVAGDANRDGRFNSADLIDIMQRGKYRTGQPASWGEGDWNGDELFDERDFVVAFQAGHYNQETPAALISGDANQNRRFDIADLADVMPRGKYRADRPASWDESDFMSALRAGHEQGETTAVLLATDIAFGLLAAELDQHHLKPIAKPTHRLVPLVT